MTPLPHLTSTTRLFLPIETTGERVDHGAVHRCSWAPIRMSIKISGLRIGRQAATFYVTDDVVSPIDDRTATAVDQHRAINLDAERCRRRR